MRAKMAFFAFWVSAHLFASGSALAQSDVPAKERSPNGSSMSPNPSPRGEGQSPADDRVPPPPAPPGPAGDWFALKSRLAKSGVGVWGRYVSESAWNYAGGTRGLVTETGEFDLGLRLDLRRIAGTDGTFQATITRRRGIQLDARAGLGTLQEVQEIYGRGRAWRLTQFWYEHRFHDGDLAVKLGRTAPSEDFASFSCAFQNLSFCGSQPGTLVTSYWYNWPVSQWGVRVRADFGRASAQIAAYEINPRNLNGRFTLGYFSGATGVLVPAEIKVTLGGQNGGPIGSYKLGGWLNTAGAPDVFLDAGRQPISLTNLPPLQRSSAYGFWINIEQQITGRSRDGQSISGLSLFLNLTQADRLTSPVDNQVVMGLFQKGVLPWIVGDLLGAAIVRTQVNGRIARGQRLAGRPEQHAEYAVELFYGFRPLRWLDLKPNLQWIHHAGGYRGSPEIGVLGLKAELRL